MRIKNVIILSSLIFGLLGGGSAQAEADPPPAPEAPQTARLVVFEAFTRLG